MAEYGYRRKFRVDHEWVVPSSSEWGATPVELEKALTAARYMYEGLHDRPPAHDDWCRIFAADDEIVIRLVEFPTREPQP